jgi:ATP-dependent DNA ligase
MRRRKPQHYAAFDVLWLDSKDLRRLSFIERKRILKSIEQPAPVFYVGFDSRGIDLFRVFCESDLEGDDMFDRVEDLVPGGAKGLRCLFP